MQKTGFSLIEMVTVVAILLALSFFAIPTLEIVHVKAREKQLRERLFEMRRAIDAYTAARNTSGNSPYPPSFASLVATMPVLLLKPGANIGPYIASDSLGNPFKNKGDVFLWDICEDQPDGLGQRVWQKNKSDPAAVVANRCVFDVRYPEDGVDGWTKAIDDTLYTNW